MKKLFLASLFCFLVPVLCFTQEARQIDEFSDVFCEDYLARMDNLLVNAQENLDSTVYIFVYEGKEKSYKGKLLNPTRGSAKAKIDSMKKYISNVKNFSLENFSFVEAGFRENSTVEFWIVSKGVEPPKIKPTLDKIKYRKGKPKGFCIYCC